jgi:pimeloyl-ACP methyl ester carboxylesterase
MRRNLAIALTALAGVAAISCTAIYALNETARRWGPFYFWKFYSGKSHGGQDIRVDDIRIHCETFGAGPPVLVLHGAFGTIEDMSDQIRALAKSHFVIAVDSRGHGRSTDGSVPLNYSLMSDDMVKVLDHLKVDRVDVVGWSDGGIIGLDLAMRHPERVRRLVAIGANYDVDGLAAMPPDEEAPRTPIRYWLLAPDPAHWSIFHGKVVTMLRTQPQYTVSDLGRIKVPTLVMAGEHDLIKREHTDQLAKSIPGSQESIIAGASHAAPLEKPEIVNAKILSFLDGTVQ